MPKYTMKAMVRSVISEEITLEVDSENQDEAKATIEKVLQSFPYEGHNEKGVSYAKVDKRDLLETYVTGVTLEAVAKSAQ